jgi:hypothetical protein
MNTAGRDGDAARKAVSAYKTILRDWLDSRPSGTRQRLADAMGKNRSFITQITNPTYAVPIPAQHLPVILEICHITGAARADFLRAFTTAHPRRAMAMQSNPRLRNVMMSLPDFGDAARNQAFDAALKGLIQNLTTMTEQIEMPTPMPNEQEPS